MALLSDTEVIIVNVSGIRYELQKRTVDQIPGSLLHVLSLSQRVDELPFGVYRVRNRKTFFVQRSPHMFDSIVLPCYTTGKLHVPKWMCTDQIIEELKFWQLDLRYACHCCAEESSKSEETTSENGDEKINELINNDAIKTKSKWQKFRELSWEFLDQPSSSVFAMIFGVISFVMVLISIGTLVAESFKEIYFCPLDDDGSQNDSDFSHGNQSVVVLVNGTNTSKANSNDNFNRLLSVCDSKRILQIVELVTVVYFTVELILRIIFCPTLKRFFKSPQNIIDVLATVPFYIEITLTLFYDFSDYRTAHNLFFLIQILRSFRVIRILKLARYIQELRILGCTLNAARDELCMLILFVMMASFIFSSIMYQFEKDEPNSDFSSIPASCWWGLITLTTVGYGDVVPKTIGGKLLASIACLSGTILMAFPVSILVEHFTSAYKKKHKRKFVIPKFRHHVTLPPTTVIPLLMTKDIRMRRQHS